MTGRKVPPAAWKPGQSGNPRGRPKGALNKTTRAVLALMEGDAESITRVAIEAAKGGDLTAIRLVLDRIVPHARERPVELPSLPDTSSAAGVSAAQQRILEAVARGAITPGEASTLSNILEQRRRSIETAQLEARIAALESPNGSKER